MRLPRLLVILDNTDDINHDSVHTNVTYRATTPKFAIAAPLVIRA